MILFALGCYTNLSGFTNLVGVLELHKNSRVTDCYRLFCFLTNSVFYVLFAYFDESMSSIGGYEPQITWNIVDITTIRVKNEFTTVPKW